MERSKAGTKKKKSRQPNYSWVFCLPGSLHPKAVDELLNLGILGYWGDIPAIAWVYLPAGT